MTRTIENIAASEVSAVLAQQGIDPARPVTVLIEETLADIARRTREEAHKRGMTDAIFAELMQSHTCG